MKDIGVLIYTYNRVDDAKINMEIIRNAWEKSDFFDKEIVIIHSFNGKKEWYPKKYLENRLVISKNSWHFQGAADLIDAGIKTFQKKYKKIKYVIVLAADTWLIDPGYVKDILKKMKENKQYLATCAWGLPERNDMRDVGVATDFFVIDLQWTMRSKMFPMNFKLFCEKYYELLLYKYGSGVSVEKLFFAKYLKAISAEGGYYGGVDRRSSIDRLLHLKEREFVHSHKNENGEWIRKMYWPELGLLTHHQAQPKKDILLANNITEGENIKRLLESDELGYYNNGISKMELNAN